MRTKPPSGDFITAAKAAGWNVKMRVPAASPRKQRSSSARAPSRASPNLGAEVTRRYPRLVPSHIDFLMSVSQCVNAKKTAWFLSESDYQTTKDSSSEPWRWNELELMSLDAAKGDTAWQKKIRRFWDSHMPFFISVEAGDYDYLALDVSPKGFGSIVHGVSTTAIGAITQAAIGRG